LKGGRKGGSSRSPRKLAAARRLMQAINVRRRQRKFEAAAERKRQAMAQDIQRNVEASEPVIVRPQPKWPSYRSG